MLQLPTSLPSKHFPIRAKHYFQEIFPKKQIVLHYTGSNGNAEPVVNGWQTRLDGKGRICTPYVINKEGVVFCLYDPKYWAYHLGVTSRYNLEKTSIGIEICNWGHLTYKDGKYRSYRGTVVPEREIVRLEKLHRGYRFFQKFTPQQIESTVKLVEFLGKTFDIPTTYDYNHLFQEKNPDAITGQVGLYSHCAYKAKVDIFPDPNLIRELKKLP